MENFLLDRSNQMSNGWILGLSIFIKSKQEELANMAELSAESRYLIANPSR